MTTLPRKNCQRCDREFQPKTAVDKLCGSCVLATMFSVHMNCAWCGEAQYVEKDTKKVLCEKCVKHLRYHLRQGAVIVQMKEGEER